MAPFTSGVDHLLCRLPSQAQHLAATAPWASLNNDFVEHGPFGCNVLSFPWNVGNVLPEVGIKSLAVWDFCQVFPVFPHHTSSVTCLHYSLPPDPTHYCTSWWSAWISAECQATPVLRMSLTHSNRQPSNNSVCASPSFGPKLTTKPNINIFSSAIMLNKGGRGAFRCHTCWKHLPLYTEIIHA